MPKMRSLLVIVIVVSGLCAIVVHTHPTGSKNGGSAVKAPDPESLPPDTFRKLAQVLYQRGDKAENRLQRKFFYNGTITCNDGSVAGYYIRRNYNSKRWIIFLEGGWICHDDLSCSERRGREHHRMSSDRWPSVKTVGGILSADPTENPHFADANHVFVPYCSSDAWSGYATGRPASPEAATNTGDLAFMGGNIVREVIRELADFQQLLYGRELYLAGSSAGGIGVMMNIDLVAGMVGRAGLRVRGIVDSGWFLDNDPFAAIECSAGKGKCSVVQNLQEGVRLWKARVPAACQQHFQGEIWKCFLGYKLFPFIKTPLFIFQWQFDTFQLYADNVPTPTSPDQWNYIHRMGNNLRGTFHNLSAVFSPACIAHEIITKSDWTTVNVEGVTLPDALQCWAQSLPDAHLDFNSDLAIRDQLGAGNEVFIAGNNRPRSVSSMLADEPLTSFKTGSNLVRAIDVSDDDMDSTRNSISTRLQKNREPNRVDRQLDLKTNTRSGISSVGDSNRLRRQKRRMRLLKQRCRHGESESCHKLRKLIKHQTQLEPDQFDEIRLDLEEEIYNSDLVRSLDRRSSKRRHRRKNHGKKKKQETEEEMEKKKERKLKKQQEKEERRRKRKERREKRRLLKQQKRKEMREKRRKLEEEKSEAAAAGASAAAASSIQKRHTLKVRSVTEASQTCQFKLVDSCTFPHCNPSCPKLKNPETGQEIDFLTLLQSFGLDMSSVAKALGVDINTLNNMDREVLIHLLTAQGSED